MTENITDKKNFIENALVLLLFLVLIYALYNVLSVFLGIFTFAIIFSVSFSKLFEKLCKGFRGKRKIAAIIYGLLLLGIVALPFSYIIKGLVSYVNKAQEVFADIKNNQIPALPEWISGIPFLGKKASGFWSALEKDPITTLGAYESQIKSFLSNMLSAGGGIASAGLELVVGIIISAAILSQGEKTLQPLETILNRLLGKSNSNAVINASGRAIKGVAVGVMGTALIETLLAWVGFAIVGLHFAMGLAALTFFMVVIQVGPLVVWLPVAIWLASQGQTGWAIFITIYGLVVLMGVDNILKPMLIAKSGKLPVLVLFLGVIGGMAAWGFTGMFKGAIILAVAYTIFQSWDNDSDQNEKNIEIVHDHIEE